MEEMCAGIKAVNIEEQKQEFLTELRKVKRDGIEGLINYLESSDFFTAPSSKMCHGSFDGGLCAHSLAVLKRLRSLYKEYLTVATKNIIKEFDEESLIVCALLHDLCKVNTYHKYLKNIKNETTGQWEQEEAYKIDELLYMGHSAKSLFIIERYIKLDLEEYQAIYFHMGGWGMNQSDMVNVGNAYAQNPLAVLLHLADMEATYLDRC